MDFRPRRTRRVRDFHRKKLFNPYFKRTPGRSFGGILKGIVVLAFLTAVLYGAIYSNAVRVRTVTVEGVEMINKDHIIATARQSIAGYRYLAIPRDHILIADTNAVRDAIATQYQLRSVSVTKKFRSLTVVVEERRETFRLFDPGTSYILDQDGLVLKTAAGEGEDLIAIKRDEETALNAGTSALNKHWAPSLISIHQYFATQVGIRDQFYKLDMANGTVTVVTVEEWQAIFDPNISIESQVTSLASAVVGKFGPTERQKLEYIDVRFGDRVFYKWK